MKINDFSIRKIEEKDLGVILKWRNSDRIRKNMYNDKTITLDEHLNWYRNWSKDNKDIYFLFLFEKEPIGVISFNKIDEEKHKCYWGFYIGNKNRPLNSGMIMGYLGLEYIFYKRDILQVFGESFVFNEASINFHKRLGFKDETIMKNYILKDGKYQDVVRFWLRKRDWEVNRQRVKNLIENSLMRCRDE